MADAPRIVEGLIIGPHAMVWFRAIGVAPALEEAVWVREPRNPSVTVLSVVDRSSP